MQNYRIELTQASDADGEFVVSEQDRDVIFAVIDECYTLSDRFNFYGSVSFVPTTDDVTPDIDWFEHFGLIDYRDLDSDIDVMVNNLDAESINDAELAGQAAADKIVAAVLAKCPSAQLPELKIGNGPSPSADSVEIRAWRRHYAENRDHNQRGCAPFATPVPGSDRAGTGKPGENHQGE